MVVLKFRPWPSRQRPILKFYARYRKKIEKIVSEELDRAYASGTSNRTLDDILVSALEKADKIKTQQKQHEL